MGSRPACAIAVGLAALFGVAPIGVATAAAARGAHEAQATGDTSPLGSAPDGVEGFDPRGLPGLPRQAGTGPRVPDLHGITLDGTQSLSTSLAPHLRSRTLRSGQVTYSIETLAGAKVWSTTTSSGQAQVGASVLHQGSTYLWRASTANGQADGPYVMRVDVQRPDAQRTLTYGAATVTLTTGEPVISFDTEPMSAASGSVGVALAFQSSNARRASQVPGLPSGWRIGGGGTFESLRWLADGWVELEDEGGRVTPFHREAGGVWVPRFGAGQTWPTGQLTTLVQNGTAGDFSVTERGGAVTVFPAVSATRKLAHPSSTWSSKEPTVQQRYDSTGRLVALVDPVSGRRVVLRYNDSASSGCPVPVESATGVAPAPRRMLCAVEAWDGSRTDLYYDGSAASSHISRVVSDAQAPGSLVTQTDIGWDSVGRPTRVRSPLANAGLAAGVLTGYSAASGQAPELLTTLQYDSRGRVSSITRPAALVSGRDAQPARGQRTLRYGPEGTTQAFAPGRQAPVMAVVAQPSTMLVTESRDAAGRVTTASWDAARQVVKQRTLPGGLTERWTYDSLGNVLSKVGPSTHPNDLTAPRVEHDYDTRPACVPVAGANEAAADMAARRAPARACRRTVRRPVSTTRKGQREMATSTISVTGPYSEPMRGLRTTYWANGAFSGTPAGASIGPVLGTNVPAEMNLNWGSSPVRAGIWSGRLEGLLEAPATGSYAIELASNASLWVNDERCAPRCDLSLKKGTLVPVRIDVTSSPTGQAGLRVNWTGPGVSGALPTAHLRPGLPQATRTRGVDDLGSGGLRAFETAQAFDASDPSRVTRTISPSGMVGEATYEPYDPSSGKYARATSGTTSPGRRAVTSYYGGTEAAAPEGCPVAGSATVQGGLAKEYALPGPAESRLRTRQVYDAAGRLLAQYRGDVLTSCITYDAAGNAASTWVPDTDGSPSVTSTSINAVGNNPFVSRLRAESDGQSLETTSMIDLLGRPVAERDAVGTVTTTSYDAFDRNVESTARTAAGESTTLTSEYSDSFDLARTLRDGVVLATYAYDAAGRMIGATYANGATMSTTFDANGYASNRTLTAGGATMSEREVLASSGRILQRTITGPGANAQWSYRYDLDSRLIGARLTGTVPDGVATGAWSYVLDQASQRTSVTTPSTGTQTYTYDSAGRMTATSDPAFAGGFAYDALGRAVTAGPLSIAYASTGGPRRISDGTTTVASVMRAGVEIGQSVTTTSGGQPVTRTVLGSSLGLMLDGDGRIASQSLALPGGVVADLPPPGGTGEIDWAYMDAHGSVAWRASGSAAPATTALYDPDGNRLNPGAPNPSGVDPAHPNLGWQAGDGLATTPLSIATVQMGLRTYVPRLGVFLQPDPSPGASVNDYGYAAADPINASDPTGDMPEWGSIVIASAVATVAGAVIAAAATKLIAVKVAAMLAAKGVAATKVAAVQGAIVGGLAGSGGDLAGQLAVKGFDGFEEVDWKAVLYAGLAGAASGGSAEWYAKRTELKNIAGGKAINAADDIAELDGGVNQGTQVNPRVKHEQGVQASSEKVMVTMDAIQTDFEQSVLVDTRAKNISTGLFEDVQQQNALNTTLKQPAKNVEPTVYGMDFFKSGQKQAKVKK